MRKYLIPGVIFIILVFAGVVFFTRFLQRNNTENDLNALVSPGVTSPATATNSKTSLFVPYWQLAEGADELPVQSAEYDRLIYFGIAATADGIDTSEPGYTNLPTFVSASLKEKWLTVRMVDQNTNDAVLDSQASQQAIAKESVEIAKRYGFTGVVLDFEYNSLFGGKIDDVTGLYQLFRNETNREQLEFGATIYGDVFYRKRPYDLARINPYVDEILIMAYDFHKSRGEPGPNFPLRSGRKYGYSYDELTNDLTKVVPTEKLTFIFGMYGYDWKVDEQKRPITQARSLTTAQIQKEFIDNCDVLHCTVLKDPVSAETEVNYIDGDTRYHIIWFENKESSQKKEDFLKEKGINSTAFWAYGYF